MADVFILWVTFFWSWYSFTVTENLIWRRPSCYNFKYHCEIS